MLDMHRLSLFDQGELWYTPDGKYTMDDFYTGWNNILTVSSGEREWSFLDDDGVVRLIFLFFFVV